MQDPLYLSQISENDCEEDEIVYQIDERGLIYDENGGAVLDEDG